MRVRWPSPRRGGRCAARCRSCRSAWPTRGRPAGSGTCGRGRGTRRHRRARPGLDIDQAAERAALDAVRRQLIGVGLRRDDGERQGHDGGPWPLGGVDRTVRSTQAPETSTAGCATARRERYYPAAVHRPVSGERVADDPGSAPAPRRVDAAERRDEPGRSDAAGRRDRRPTTRPLPTFVHAAARGTSAAVPTAPSTVDGCRPIRRARA